MALILIIEDSSFQRNFITRILEGAGHEVVQAHNGQMGLEKVASNNPQIVLCDLLMPDLDGFGFLEAVRGEGNKLPVIMLTSDIQTSSKNRCLELGANYFLNKPPVEKELLEVLEKVSREGSIT
jgi:CheY-like chemotaxis protein